MAEVFAGYVMGDHGFQKPVAIKRLLPELAVDHVFVERLIEEAKLLVGMQHGNIVSVMDLARDGDDVFLVMEFVDGPSLRQLIKARGSRGISPAISTYILQAACQGLEFAHTRKGGAIIHADISPSNLLLTTSGEVRVADFGIARREGGGQGVVEGKWAYMAPEQARGEALDPRADVFAMGVVLYELLTGAHPFGRQVTHEERDSQPMRVIPPRVVKPSVPHGLDAVCMKALSHEKRDRYSSMQKLMDAIVEERFANQYREGASDLAAAIRECNPQSAAQAAGNPRTMITDRPVTIMTKSLLRELTPMRRSQSPSQAPQLPVPRSSSQPLEPAPRASSPPQRSSRPSSAPVERQSRPSSAPVERQSRPSSAPMERPSQPGPGYEQPSQYSQYSQHSQAAPGQAVERPSVSQYSQHSQHASQSNGRRASQPGVRPSSSPMPPQPSPEDAARAAAQVMLQMPPGLVSQNGAVPSFKMPMLQMPEPVAAPPRAPSQHQPAHEYETSGKLLHKVITVLALVGIIAVMYWRLTKKDEVYVPPDAPSVDDVLVNGQGDLGEPTEDTTEEATDEEQAAADDGEVPEETAVPPPVVPDAAIPIDAPAVQVGSGSAVEPPPIVVDSPPPPTGGSKRNPPKSRPDRTDPDRTEQTGKRSGTGTLRVQMDPWGYAEVDGVRKEVPGAKFTLQAGRYRVTLIEGRTKKRASKLVQIEPDKTTNLSYIWGESE